MYKFLAILTIILTLCICITKPQMHRTVLVYNSDYAVVEPKVETTVSKSAPTVVEMTKTNTTSQAVEVPKTETKTLAKQTSTTTTIPKQIQTKTVQQKPVETAKTTTQTTPAETKTVKIPEKTLQVLENKPSETVKTIKIDPKPVTMTEQQEEIAWNVWRSNLQNRIMQDTKIPYIFPQGTAFKFSFDVDMYGRITNVQTCSLTPQFTPYAIQYIAPVIRNLQGKSILHFPTGTKRTSTHVEGQWRIGRTNVYSKPQDYNDIEVNKK